MKKKVIYFVILWKNELYTEKKCFNIKKISFLSYINGCYDFFTKYKKEINKTFLITLRVIFSLYILKNSF